MPSIRRTAKLTVDREVTVLRRYSIKVDHNDLCAGDIVLVVRNDKGIEYTVKLRKSTKRHECNCASWKPCCHINAMVSIENARWQAGQAAKKAEQYTMSDALHAKLAEAEVKVVAPKRATRHEEDTAAKTKIAAKLGPIWKSKKALEDATLNGSSQGFSLLRR